MMVKIALLCVLLSVSMDAFVTEKSFAKMCKILNTQSVDITVRNCNGECSFEWLDSGTREVCENITTSTQTPICGPQTPCGFAVYDKFERIVTEYVKSPCDCPSETYCAYDKLQQTNYVHLCKELSMTTTAEENQTMHATSLVL